MDGNAFSRCLEGSFDGMIRMEHVERLKARMAGLNGWYLVAPGGELPQEAVSGEQARDHLGRLVEEILQEERGVWTTMVYAQSAENPEVIKVFHPRRAGTGCGCSSAPVVPWWVLSRVVPEPVAAWGPPGCATPEAKPWWKKMI